MSENREIFVILIDGEPYLDRNYSAIRTYKTRDRAEKEARNLVVRDKRWGRKRGYEVGVFSATAKTAIKEDAN